MTRKPLNISVASTLGVDATNIFDDKKRKASFTDPDGARCDMQPAKCSLREFNGDFDGAIRVVSKFRRSLKGRTLKEYKEDPESVELFAQCAVDLISSVFGQNLDPTQFAIVPTPKRRHREFNFGEAFCTRTAELLGIPCFCGVGYARTNKRIQAEFELMYLPPNKNLIVLDDFVTTGSTFMSMRRMFNGTDKSVSFFAIINNS